jgi:hypothetical protein
VTDALGKITGITYDATGHTLTVTASNPSGSRTGPVTTYTCSDGGRERSSLFFPTMRFSLAAHFLFR